MDAIDNEKVPDYKVYGIDDEIVDLGGNWTHVVGRKVERHRDVCPVTSLVFDEAVQSIGRLGEDIENISEDTRHLEAS